MSSVFDRPESNVYDVPLAIYHCCRDWPCNPLARIGRCGYCGEVPEWTDKTVEQYMEERRSAEQQGR